MSKLIFSPSYKRDFRKLPSRLQEAAEKQIRAFLLDRSHPSLQLKKMKGYENIWEIRISQGYRIFFSFLPDAIVFHRVGPHDLNRRPF